MRIPRMTDRVKLSVGELTFIVAPLSRDQKREISQTTVTIEGGEPQMNLWEAQALYLKYGLKKIEGLKDYHGKDYVLKFENNGLTEECLSELWYVQDNLEHAISYIAQTMNTLPDEYRDYNGKKVKGVKLEILSAEMLVT